MRIAKLLSLGVALLATAAVASGKPPGQVKDQTIELKELHGPARVLRDVDGMPHVYAHDEHDALFLQGWLQAQDRLFQIDVLRRTASGTLAELLGPAALPSDVQLRTLGLRRAAERSLQAYTPQMRRGLDAYAAGVNAWVARNRLPPEYGVLEITKFAPWSALDSAVIGKALAFQLSFDLDVQATLDYLEYQRVLAPINPQLGDAAFFLDVFRSAPFDPAASVPDATTASVATVAAKTSAAVARDAAPPQAQLAVSATAERLLRSYRDQVRQVPFLERTLKRAELQIGSNEWAVVGSRTRDGRPLVANDPHLGLDLPATFYQMQLVGRTDGFDAIGSSVTGTPWIVLGQNRHVTWGETTTGFDVTDTYLEQIQALPDGRLFTIYQGQLEPIQVIPVTFRYNIVGDGQKDLLATASGGGIPPVVLVVPRRNNGPIVQLDSIDPATGRGTAISVQWAGNGATRELETFRLLNRARNLDDFKAALQYFDTGSQNFIYGDIDGNIGYFTTGEVPLREDLQANTVTGAPPWFIREGTGGNEWLVRSSAGPRDGTGYEYLPFEELPQTVNPRNGFVVNANNDPAGVTLDNNPVNQLRPGYNGIYYLGYAFDFGTRAGRITQALRERLAQGRVGKRDMQAIQADVKLLDAEVLAPYIVRALANAQAPGAPAELAALAAAPGVAEAVGRLGRWNYTAPTGLATGYDAADKDGYRFPPSQAEVNHSIAATIYSVWRGQAIMNGVDRTLGGYGLPTPGSGEAIKSLRHLVERNGIGLSGIDFFGWAGLATAEQRRDLVLLASLKSALDLLAGPTFAAAFGQSADQNGFRWGKLHRIVFDSVLGQPFSIPGATPGFEPSVPGLRGLSVDGGFGAVDASSHSARAASLDAFMFGSGPNRRYVGSPGTAAGSIEAETILPGGMSGVLGNKFYANLLGRYLTNDTYPLRQNVGEVMQALDSQQQFKPKH